jgi:periplasmic mercuric ion binding protein
MKHSLNLALVVAFGVILFSGESEAAHQYVNIRLSGKYCGFYQIDVAKELKQIPGVIEVDFESMRGHVYVTMIAGKVHPLKLLAAIQRVKGDGYYCTGQFEGEPGRIEH